MRQSGASIPAGQLAGAPNCSDHNTLEWDEATEFICSSQKESPMQLEFLISWGGGIQILPRSSNVTLDFSP